jgi:hypothetical protein
MRDCFRFVKKWSSGDIGNIVSFSIIFFQEPLRRWYGNVICMFILRSLTGGQVQFRTDPIYGLEVRPT